jgi:hypothetical protein
VAKEPAPETPVREAKQATSTKRPVRGPQPKFEKQRVATTGAADVESKADRSSSDADWLAAVRHALVNREPMVPAQAATAPAPLSPPPAVQAKGELSPTASRAAPPLAPPTAVTNVTAPERDDDHPVPPALIPDVGRGPAR